MTDDELARLRRFVAESLANNECETYDDCVVQGVLDRLDAERARAAALEAALRRLTDHLPDYWEDVADARRLLGGG